MRYSRDESSPLFVSLCLSPHLALSSPKPRGKKKEFLPRFCRRVGLGRTLLFTCRAGSASRSWGLSRILVPILLLFAVLILAKCCDRHPAVSFLSCLLPHARVSLSLPLKVRLDRFNRATCNSGQLVRAGLAQWGLFRCTRLHWLHWCSISDCLCSLY